MRIALIQGHPDPRGGRFCHALAEAYAQGAKERGRDVRTVDVARLEFPLLQPGRMGKRLLKGRSARLIVTMGMPAFFYRLYFRAHGMKSLKRNILEFCGVSPVRTSLVGTVESASGRQIWLAKMQLLGRSAK